MTKKNIMPVAVLTAICVIVAALISAANLITAPIISDRNAAAVSESLGAVMPGGQFNSEPDELKAGAPATIKQVYTEKNGKGTVIVLLTNKGYTGKNIGFTVGIDTEGKITGMKVTENGESIVPDMLKPGGSYGESFVGAGADDIADVSTGATVKVTEGAIKAALKDAFLYLGLAEEEVLPREEAEILALAKTLYGEGADKLKSSTPENTTYVKRIYKENGKGAFVAYAYVISQYGTPEFELLIHVGEDGKVKAIEKLLWKVSDPNPEKGWYPPADDIIDGFFDSFVGTDEGTAPSVDVQTGATYTSTRVREAAVEALSLFKPALPREEAEVEALARELYGEGADKLESLIPEDTTYVARIYKENGKGAFVAYAFAISRYGTPEFELLIHVGEDGKIKAVEKLLWKVSDPNPEYGWYPPADDIIDGFFESFVGTDKGTAPSVDVQTGATNTSTRVREAVVEALMASDNNAPRIIGIVALTLSVAAFAAYMIVSKKRRAGK